MGSQSSHTSQVSTVAKYPAVRETQPCLLFSCSISARWVARRNVSTAAATASFLAICICIYADIDAYLYQEHLIITIDTHNQLKSWMQPDACITSCSQGRQPDHHHINVMAITHGVATTVTSDMAWDDFEITRLERHPLVGSVSPMWIMNSGFLLSCCMMCASLWYRCFQHLLQEATDDNVRHSREPINSIPGSFCLLVLQGGDFLEGGRGRSHATCSSTTCHRCTNRTVPYSLRRENPTSSCSCHNSFVHWKSRSSQQL